MPAKNVVSNAQSLDNLGYGRKAPMRERKITYGGPPMYNNNNHVNSAATRQFQQDM